MLAVLTGGNVMAETMKKAIFAGGCFWCMQSEFHNLKGVQSTLVGYAGGAEANPTYEQVSSGKTGHREALEITYNPAEVSYDKLLDVFWSNVDPLDATGQFCDQGPQYKSGVFVSNEAERTAAEASKAILAKQLGEPVFTDILPTAKFWPAEEYHQNYHAKNPFKYKLYRTGCGRDGRLQDLEKRRQSP
jgi:peptide-methionine (S)-S-oxide reductase